MIAPPSPPLHEDLELLIKEARDRQLRRRLIGAAGIAIAAAVSLGIYVAARGTQGSRNPTGLDRLLLRLTNESSHACVVAGFPVFRFYDRRGTIPFQYDRDGVVKAVLLRPSRSAYTVVSKFRCDIGVSRSATRGTIGLTSDPHKASFVGGPAICKPGIPAEGRIVLVDPFEPTQRLAYETSLAQS